MTESAVIRLPERFGTVEGHHWPLVPDGVYSVSYKEHQFAVSFGVPRLFVHFQICDFGDHFEKVLYRCYRLKSLKSPGRKNSAFTVGRRSDFLRELALVTLKRPDRLLPTDFEGKLLAAKVETVRMDYKQREIPRPLQYSLIRSIQGIKQ